ncbi:MFS transporter [Streptomyces spinoverrucosus]|uniref:MFS transporter n=1 Tax=Streptomyces spinoverrucosus TaxID=284043 RepID=UPI0018C39C67|nr:MFS transporter [Streptomyces spinoverrucosus]MBG0854571.1 MFS transporter [Streptomyces spinoverrucosus]
MDNSNTSTPSTPAVAGTNRMSRGLALLFAIAGGTAVANLYWAQPLLDFMADDLHASHAVAGWLVTATQIGYAAGALLLVPLGDVLDRRRFIPGLMLCAAVALIACALAPSIGVFLVAITLLGLTTVSGQLLTPLAGDLADDTHRGQVVGTVVSGLLIGILVSRTISGLIADAAGWRAIYVVAAAAAVVFALLLRRAIPQLPPKAHLPYPRLLLSVWQVIRQERTVRWTLALGATAFGVFTMFWTALTFLLSAEPFSYSVSVIGLFGLIGLVGALAAQRAGRLHDRGWSLPATGWGWAAIVVSFVVAAIGERSVVLIIVAIVLLDIAVQGVNILNQTRLFAIAPGARSRLNTAFVTCNFVGGAIGSAAASALWSAGGWTAVSLTGAVLGCAALLMWALGCRGPLHDQRNG